MAPLLVTLVSLTALCVSVVFAHFPSSSSSSSSSSLSPLSVCNDTVETYSYHVHVLFNANEPDEVAFAMNLQHEFYDAFNLAGKKNCTAPAGDPWNGGDFQLCQFRVEWMPDGPFLTAQYSWFVPPKDMEAVLTWVLKRKGSLSVLRHGNSGCETLDHTAWAMWAGQPWHIDASIFSCDSPGCIPKH